MWMRSLAVIASILGIAAACAWWLSEAAAALWLALALVGYALHHLAHLARLDRWLALPQQRELPHGLGAWSRVLDRLARFVKSEAETRQALAAELERIHAAVDRLPSALIVLDRFDHVLWANRAAEQLHGIYGLQLPIHHHLRQPAFLAYLQSSRSASAATDAGVQLQLPAHPGRTFLVKLYDAADAQRLMITQDVTDQIRIDAMRRDFVANVSHEIRTPLTVISGFVETMLDLPLDEAARQQYLQTILQQAGTLRQLVEDLLMLSTLEHGSNSATHEPVPIHALLRALVDEARTLSGGRHAITLALDGPQAVRAHPSELQSAVRNLLTNAIRYTPAGGSIDVRWQRTGAEGWIVVQDTGIGIAPEHVPRLTERFYRVDRARSRDTGGTGLGLAIVKHIVQRHQAQLQIKSRPGAGSTFTIRLPAARLIDEAAPNDRPAAAQAADSSPA